uniref:Uncharacterized protein n=1 Tax=Romanomermis culicivorax TaxID=13658 RepID=A0A915JGL5_ROMCU
NLIPINYNVKPKIADLPPSSGLPSVSRNPIGNSNAGQVSVVTTNDTSSSSSFYNCDGLSVDDRVFCLTGPLLTLSNYYATPIFIKSKRYRSVEHYVYEKFVRYANLSEKFVEKVTTTSDPAKLPLVALKFIPRQRFGQLTDDEKLKMTIWYDRAIRKKLRTYDILKQLLLSTENALLIEANNYQYDAITTVGVSEQEVVNEDCVILQTFHIKKLTFLLKM